MRVAVVGAGVVGLATAASLLSSGARVSCFEAVGAMSQRSTGASRIFRLAHGSASLVELAVLARSGYARWGAAAGRDLVGAQGVVLAGSMVPGWAAAMRAASVAAFEVPAAEVAGAGVSSAGGTGAGGTGAGGVAGVGGAGDVGESGREVPVPLGAGSVLVDPAGGVIDAAGVGEFLLGQVGPHLVPRAVRRIEPAGNGALVHPDGADAPERFDAVVLAAGAGTAELAGQVGLAVPTGLVRHARFTFRLPDPAVRPPCVLDRGGAWRAGFTSYQHLAAPGEWAIGAHQLGVDEAADRVDKSTAIANAREFTVAYVRENLPAADPEPIAQVYCDSLGGWGDGYVVARSGAILEVHGDNLFKFAPVLGDRLAAAALDGSTPPSDHPS